MKLLFDENLSPRLEEELSTLFPESKHVRNIGMKSALDQEIWEFAIKNQFTIVSKDADFRQLSILYGPPPKVIWLNTGNCSTKRIIQILRSNKNEVYKFNLNSDTAFLELS